MNWKFWKKLPKEFLNVDHVDLVDKVEPAFKVKGVQYYCYKGGHDAQMMYGRYKWVDTYLNELALRMNLETLNAYLDELTKILDGKSGTIHVSDAHIVIYKMRSRVALKFEPQAAKNLASVVYFDATEDLSTYSKKHAEEKIRVWEEAGSLDFFLTRPMKELLGLKDSSDQDLVNYLNQASEILTELTSGQGSPSPGST